MQIGEEDYDTEPPLLGVHRSFHTLGRRLQPNCGTHPNANSDCNHYPNSHDHPIAHADGHADPQPDTDAHTHDHTYAHRDVDAHCNAYTVHHPSAYGWVHL